MTKRSIPAGPEGAHDRALARIAMQRRDDDRICYPYTPKDDGRD